ncbi:MAG: glycosyltransferase family 2 protein, partial [Erysipelotrichaceae bacterium]|nr:glycosyltransferase family 2 protein [Erysipelotrichaceae bacterium]
MKLMSDKTELSVIMPCYNEHERIHDAIMSILEQSYRDFEFIIVDDCSTDESPVIIKKMMAE